MRVLIVDDSPLARETLTRLVGRIPGFQVVGAAEDGDVALRLVPRLKPDLVLMDIVMPRCDGLLATRILRRNFPEVRVIILTVLDRPEEFWEAIRSGAQGYLVKHLGPSQLARALQQLAQHREPLSPDLAQHLLQPFVRRLKSGSSSAGAQPQAASMDWSCLTGREREVARLVAEGYTDREIAQQLSISEHTVKNHVKKCLAKTRSKNRAQLAALVAGLPTAMGAAKPVMHHRR